MPSYGRTEIGFIIDGLNIDVREIWMDQIGLDVDVREIWMDQIGLDWIGLMRYLIMIDEIFDYDVREIWMGLDQIVLDWMLMFERFGL